MEDFWQLFVKCLEFPAPAGWVGTADTVDSILGFVTCLLTWGDSYEFPVPFHPPLENEDIDIYIAL